MENSLLQIGFLLIVLLVLIKPVGWYMAQVYEGKNAGVTVLFRPIENFIYHCCGIHPENEMTWRGYALAMLMFNLMGFIAAYLLQYFQGQLPLNPQHMPGIPSALAFNTAVSFVSNTNWQAYSGESMMSYLTQMLVFTVQNFVSAATGMAILVAFIRGLVRRETQYLGNFWVDMVRSTLYILLPLSIIFAVVLNAQGVIQNFHASQTVNLLQPLSYQTTTTDSNGHTQTQNAIQTTQTIPMGPVASQTAIEELGSNGGGYFNVNSAHPLQNPTPLSNFLEMLAILLIPAALCYTFGKMVGDTRQGWAVLIAMFFVLLPLILVTVH
ncbi:MAG: potassium-transporting ATPase subunit KdpA, partial [Gammaproteobacteria bacterium]|nr:potassium-transporting ATPase subunit KdpA [Gammaproteobacteria bacterium]